jgi:hypothetical protein
LDDIDEPDLATVYGESLQPLPPGLIGQSVDGVEMGSASERVRQIAWSRLATPGSLSDEDRAFLSAYQELVGPWFDSQPDDVTRDYVARLGGLATYLLAQR